MIKPSSIRWRSTAKCWEVNGEKCGLRREGRKTDEGAEEHHKGGGEDETLVEVLAFAVIDEDPNGGYEEECRGACGGREGMVIGRDGGD